MPSFRIAVSLALIASGAVAHAADGGAIDGVVQGALRRDVSLVYVEEVAGRTFTPPPAPATMNQIRNTYQPHLLPVLVGSEVEFKSVDPELHNVYARATGKTLFNIAIPPSSPIAYRQRFDKVGVVKLSCNVHREMLAFVVVLQNPYFAVPDKSGKFRIEGVPAGRYVLRVWGESIEDDILQKKFPVEVPSAAPTVVAVAP